MPVLKREKGGVFQLITNYEIDRFTNRSIVTIRNDNFMCFARSIVVALAKIRNNRYDTVKEYRNDLQTRRAYELHRVAGVPTDQMCTLDDIAKFENAEQIRVVVIGMSQMKRVIYKGNEQFNQTLFIVKAGDHFEPIEPIMSLTGFFRKKYFCIKCLKGYDKPHVCEISCTACCRFGCKRTPTPVTCQKCNLVCRSQECYDKHLLKPQKGKSDPQMVEQGKSPCERRWKSKML
jgi:hypothetical protein